MIRPNKTSNKFTQQPLLVLLLLLFTFSVSAQSPGGVSGNNLLWMKADTETYEDASPGTDATEDTDDVLQWHDQSGNSHDAIYATGSYPHYDEDAFNFNPGLVFTQSSSEYLQIENGIFDGNTLTGVSAYVVTSHSTATHGAVFNEPLLNTEDIFFLAPWSTDDIFWQVGNATVGSGRATDATWEASSDETQYIWSMGNNSSNATSAGEEQYIRLDGHIVDTQDGYDASAVGNSDHFYIGKWETSTSEFNGTIAELIVYDKILSATEEIQVQSYLALKYGITLNDDADNDASFGDVVTGTLHEGDYLAADGTTEIWDYDNDKLFHFDVAGIGADATSGLDQRISKSRNSDAIVTMCTEAIGTLNSGIGTALTDDAYLLWGNNNATSSAGDDLPTGYTGRLQKEWIVKMTGTVSNVHVEFDIADLGLAGDAAGDFYLLTDADGDFTASATATVATSFSGNKVTFDDFNFTDGQIFTLATTQAAPGGVSSNIRAWLKSDGEAYSDAGSTLNTNATEVQEWHDESGYSRDFTDNAGTGPDWDEDAINFNPGVDFVSGSSENLELSGGLMPTTDIFDMNCYAVFKTDIDQQQSLFWEDCVSSDFYVLHVWNDEDFYLYVGNITDGQGLSRVDWGGTYGTYHIGAFTADETTTTPSGNKRQIMLDNTSLEVGNPSANHSATGENETFYLGSQVNTNYFDGTLAEIIWYDDALTETEEDKVQSYLAVKYGITLAAEDYTASDGTVIWDYSANTAHHFDIAGLGRDNVSGLHQKISKSNSTDAIVTMCTEAIGSTNAGISTTLTNDAYLLWGNNNATTPAGDDLPSGYYGRLDKEWVVEMTGTVSNVHVEFDISSDILHLAGDAAGDFFILTDADGDFTSGATATAASSFAANKVTFNDINFTDGHFFTLATQQGGPGGVSSHLQVWLKADAEAYSDAGSTLNTNATEVQEWHDQSGGTYDFTDNAGVGPDWDEDALNFNPGVDFVSASSENLELSGGLMGTSATYDRFFYCVSRHDVDANQRFFREDCASNEYDAYVAWGGTDDVIFDVGNSTDGQGRSRGSFSDYGNYYLFGLTSDETAANTPSGSKKQILSNNTSLDTQNPTVNNSITGNGSTMYLGSGNNAEYWDGTICEAIWFSDAISETDEDKVQTYLAVKYGITLAGEDYTASAGTVIWDNATYSAYHYDIAGLGRDNVSGLHQKIGKSVESDAIVTMCTEAIGTTNAGITTAVTDQAYLLWGNNNATTSAHDDLPAGYTGRLYKEWVVEMTGTVADVHVEIDISSEKLGGDAAADFYLLTDADGDFTSGASATVATTFSSNKVTFNDIDFTDGQYFTLATIQPGPGGVSNGLLLWMKADDQAHNTGTTLATDGQTVDNWEDQSTHDFDADDSGGTGPDWDADGINYNPALDFTGGASGEPLDIPAGILEGGTKTALYAYTVCATDLDQTQGLFYQQSNVSSVNQHYAFIPRWSDGSAYYDHYSNTTGRITNSSGVTLGQPHLFSLMSDGADMEMRRDGTSLGTSTQNGTVTETTNYPFYIGTRYNNTGNYFDGKLAELIILDHIPTTQEEDQIESYLAMKYGITMAGTTTLFDADGTTVYADDATYDDGFVAIGRDDISEWDQRQSKSIETDAVLTLSTTTIAATNAANGTQIAVNNSILFAAHNDGAADVSTSELHATFAERFTREWKVGEIGTVGGVLVEMDITGLAFTNEVAANFGLVIDDDGDFTGGTQSYAIADDLTSDKVTFNSVDFTDGKYFTLMNSASALPVELLAFNVEAEGCFAHLTWTTGSELNNDFFQIQYSYDGNTWTDLDKVYGAGNSEEVINYSYYDFSCFHNTTVYYRLVQTDFDGTETNSNVRNLNLESPYAIKLFPNPAKDQVTIDLQANLLDKPAVAIIRNILGQEVMRQELSNGSNTIDVSLLSQEAYLVKVVVPNQLPYHTKLILVK